MNNNHKMNPCYELCHMRYHKKFDEEECKENCDYASVCAGLANKCEENNRLSDKLAKLEKDFMELVTESDRMCYYCKHYIKCEGKNCPKYDSGRGEYDNYGRYYDRKWTCIDFDHGTCGMLEDTPCNGCWENDMSGFKWRGDE